MTDNKTALVTGGAIRIGKEISLALAKEGYDIALHYNSSEKEAKETAATIESLGRKCSLYKEDLLQIQNIEGLVNKVAEVHFDVA